MKPNQMNSEMETPMEDKGEMMEGTPMDEAISMVESYIKHPQLATPETLGMLKEMLVEMKPMIDGDDREGMDEPVTPSDTPNEEGISGMIGKMKKNISRKDGEVK